jgi:hypothetical protein
MVCLSLHYESEDPEQMMLGVLVSSIGSEGLEPSESVVHTDQGGGRSSFGAQSTASRTGGGGRRKYSPIARAEIVVIAFDKHRPLRRKSIFPATANRPAGFGIGDRARINGCNAGHSGGQS